MLDSSRSSILRRHSFWVLLKGAMRFHDFGDCEKVTVDCRTLPGQSEEYVLDHVRKALGSDIANDVDHCSLGTQ